MIRKTVIWIGAAILLLVITVIAFSLLKSRPLFDELLDPASLNSIAIAPPDQALTFARFRAGEQPRVLLVTNYQDGKVSGFNLQRHLGTEDSDPISLYGRLGYEALQHLAASGHEQETVDVASLAIPFDAPADNIGIGTNYMEHARESQVEEKPFVFPKLVQPTHFTADVAKADSRLLDYEAELGFVTLQDLTAESTPQTMGLVLGNDFTDRWSLVLNFVRDTEMGTTGFVEGKSRASYAPIGNLLVIPRNLDAFYREIELKLYVNGRLRQHDLAGSMAWGPKEMLKEILSRESWTFRRHDGTVPLLPRAGTLPQGTIIFSGTPAGVIFKPHNLWNSRVYLKPGDEVIMRSEHLGMLHNRIIE